MLPEPSQPAPPAQPSPPAPVPGPAVPQPRADGAAPDWAVQQQEILCPLCEYNLRGLTEPRCPECGYRFAWRELFEDIGRRHRFLFEQPLHRPIWSFFRTLWGSLFPRSFWKSIHPTLPIHPRRLLSYGGVACLPLAAAAVALWVHLALRIRLPWGSAYPVPAWFWYLQGLIHDHALLLLTVWFCWPPLLLTALLIFQISMRRARIRFAHVLRCVIYSCDSALFFGGLALVAVVWRDLERAGIVSLRLGGDGPEIAATWAAFLWLGLTTWRLRQAYRHYLRFDHPLATVLVSQFLVLLTVFTAYSVAITVRR